MTTAPERPTTATTPPSLRPRLRTWARACAAGETVGMAAAAGTAGVLAATVGEPVTAGERGLVLAAMVVAGCVEGLAVGAFQWHALRRWLPRLRARAYIGVTVAVGAVGWLLGMLPVTLAPPAPVEAGGAEPPLLIMAIVVVGGGAAAGALFGAAQAYVLRVHVRHPWRWVRGNALGWAAAMTVIFLGASTAPPGLPVVTLLAWGAVTGVLAGAAVGLGTGVVLPALDEPGGSAHRPLVNAMVRTVLGSRLHRVLSGSVAVIEYVGPRTGRRYQLPVQYVREGGRLLVAVGRPEDKTWWRGFRTPRAVSVLVAGRRHRAVAAAAEVGDPGHVELVRRYAVGSGRPVEPTSPVVVLTLVVPAPADDLTTAGALPVPVRG